MWLVSCDSYFYEVFKRFSKKEKHFKYKNVNTKN